MDPSTVIDGIREYTGNGYGVHMDSLIIAQSTIYDIVGFVLGLLAFFISIGMFLITALDVCYITIPIFQDKVRSQRWDGSRGSKVRFISKDAVEAVELAYTIDNGILREAKRCKNADDIIDTTEGFTVHPAFTDESSIGFRNGGWDSEIEGIWVDDF